MTRPRVYLDGYNLSLDKGTGVATYARNLSFRLGSLGAEVGVLYGNRAAPSFNPLIREIGFFDNTVGDTAPFLRAMRLAQRIAAGPLGEYATEVPMTGSVISRTYESRLPHYDHIWNVRDLFRFSLAYFKVWSNTVNVRMPKPPQVMQWTYPLPIRVQGAKNIYTLHDLVPLRLPYTTLDNKRRYFKLCKMLVKKADHIVTVSEASRTDIINLLGCPPEKVTNTYQSVEIPKALAEKPESEARDDVMGSFGLPWKKYFLFFGAIEPKKNVSRLIEAYLASDVETPLVILGKQAWKSDEELRMLYEDQLRWFLPRVTEPITASQRRLRDRIILLDYAPFRLLVSLIRGAKAVMFPSLYEGFGLPALEAMKLGTPVMTANTSSLPEVVGDAAVKVDPYNVRAMVEAIRALDTDEELRGWLSVEGPKRADMFNAAAYERRLGAMYAQLGVKLGE